jgi:hypothetical protein
MVRISEDKTIDPKEGPVERVMAAWMVWVEVGSGGEADGLQCLMSSIFRHL